MGFRFFFEIIGIDQEKKLSIQEKCKIFTTKLLSLMNLSLMNFTAIPAEGSSEGGVNQELWDHFYENHKGMDAFVYLPIFLLSKRISNT
jgi:hypothetical protein